MAAAATTSPVKILADLGYEIWEMEIPEDYRSALIEAINTLIMTNPSDGRIPILQGAIKAVQKPKFKAKKTRLNVEKVLNITQPKLEGQKLQEDSKEVESNNNSSFEALVPRLDGIASALSGIGGILASQLSLERIAYNRQRKIDLLKEKREREKSLENEGNTIGKTLKKIIAQPIKSFGERLLQFLKSIALGTAVLSLYEWLQDEENLKKIKAIVDWLGDNGGKLIQSLIKLGKLGIASKLGNILKKVGSVFLDFAFIKPIKTLSQIIRNAITEILTGGARAGGKNQRLLLKGRNNAKKILEAAGDIKINDPNTKKLVKASKLIGDVSDLELDELAQSGDLVRFLRGRGFGDFDIGRALTASQKAGDLNEGSKIFIQNLMKGAKGPVDMKGVQLYDPKLATERLNAIIENPPSASGKKLTGPVEQVKGKELEGGMKRIVKFLEKSGFGWMFEMKGLRKLIWSGVINTLGVVDIGLDVMNAMRTWKEGWPISSMFYTLAALSSALTFALPAFAIPSIGFSLLGMATEDPKVLEGLKKGGSNMGFGLTSPGAGFGGGFPIEAHPAFWGSSLNTEPKSQDIASLIPIDPNDSGGNIAMLGGNGSQSTLSAGNNPNGSDVMTNSSVNPKYDGSESLVYQMVV